MHGEEGVETLRRMRFPQGRLFHTFGEGRDRTPILQPPPPMVERERVGGRGKVRRAPYRTTMFTRRPSA